MKTLETLVPLEFTLEAVQEGRTGKPLLQAEGRLLGTAFVWRVEEMKHFKKTDEAHLLLQRDRGTHPLLLAAGYVAPEAAARLKEAGIQFVDTAGNAFINHPPVLIWTTGKKPAEKAPLPRTGRIFRGAGLKIVFTLLCRPELAGKPYRDIAETAGVALGTAANTMAGLAERGFIVQAHKREKKLVRREELFGQWAAAYAETLRQKLLLGRFHGEREWWKGLQLDTAAAQWGGEVAAWKLTGYLKPETATLYTNRNRIAELVVANKLKKDPRGNVEILDRFWMREKERQEDDTVHPFLVYADLLAIGDQRTMETAKVIYERQLTEYFRED
ncbi:hypothetical protein E0L29_09190 [Chlorobium sp. N1]|nr:hypothetical protein E0L29_09190 [Chlorobium sp. N1]